MKFSDVLKKLGISLDDDIEIEDDVTNPPAYDEKNKIDNSKDDNKNKKVSNHTIINIASDKNKKEDKTEDKTENNIGGTKDMDYKTIKFNTDTGLFDLSNIDNEDLKNILKLSNDTVINTANKVKINSAINEKLATLKIRKGITVDAVRSLIKMDNITVDDKGAVKGIDDAFDALQKEQTGLFVQRNSTDSSPVLEGYNPVDNKNNGSNNDLEMGLLALSQELTNNN